MKIGKEFRYFFKLSKQENKFGKYNQKHLALKVDYSHCIPDTSAKKHFKTFLSPAKFKELRNLLNRNKNIKHFLLLQS